AAPERLARARMRRKRLVTKVLSRANDSRAEPQPRVLVRDDFDALSPERIVRTGLLRMPVRIEERAYRSAAVLVRDRAKQRARMLGEAAVDHHDLVAGGKGDDVRAAAGEHRYAVAERLGGDASADSLSGSCPGALRMCGAELPRPCQGRADSGRCLQDESPVK